MFSVIFEVNPRTTEWNTYLDTAKMLRPELEVVEGFVDNIRYKSLQREGWILSLSGWRDEKALVRWRTKMRHHEAQQKGRDQILQDYHLRVGQVTRDTQVPPGCRSPSSVWTKPRSATAQRSAAARLVGRVSTGRRRHKCVSEASENGALVR